MVVGSGDARNVLVAGARGGLATKLISDLIDDGCYVVGCDRVEDGADEWIDTVAGDASDRLRVETVDVTDEEEVSRLRDRLHADGRKIDAVVNTAGMQYVDNVWDLDTKYWQLVLAVNLDSTFYLTRTFIKPMIEAGWGRVVNFASVYAYQPTYGQAAYAAAKAGVVGFTRSVASDVAEHGVTVNAVAPAVVWHQGLDGVLPDDEFAYLKSRIPQGEFGEPRHVSGTVRYLLSEDGGHTTGQTIHVNGGMFPAG